MTEFFKLIEAGQSHFKLQGRSTVGTRQRDEDAARSRDPVGISTTIMISASSPTPPL